jgi:hypothetical protein
MKRHCARRHMPGGGGLAAGEALKRSMPRIKIVVETSPPAKLIFVAHPILIVLVLLRSPARPSIWPHPELVAKLFPATVVFPPMLPLSTFPAAFAVRRGDMDFVNFLNFWIGSRNAKGWLESRYAYWFKSMDWAKDL